MKMRVLVLTFSITILITFPEFGLAQMITFEKTYGGVAQQMGKSVQQTTDGGYIVVGWSNNNQSLVHNIYAIKTDENGDTVWTRTYGGEDYEEGTSVQQTYDGGYIIVGFTQSFSITPIPDVYLIKTNTDGDTLWTKTIGGIQDDRGFSVQQTLDSGYVIAGETWRSFVGPRLAYLIKTDKNGDTLWTKTYEGKGEATAYSVQQTIDTGFILVGMTLYRFNTTDRIHVFLVKTNSIGDTVWTKSF